MCSSAATAPASSLISDSLSHILRSALGALKSFEKYVIQFVTFQATGETNIPQNPRVGTKRYMAPEILDMT